MKAEQIYAALDAAGLTPAVHYCAAPYEWRMALEKLEAQIEDTIWEGVDERFDARAGECALEQEINAARKAKK